MSNQVTGIGPLRLPEEIYGHIASFLNLREASRLMRVNKFFQIFLLRYRVKDQSDFCKKIELRMREFSAYLSHRPFEEERGETITIALESIDRASSLEKMREASVSFAIECFTSYPPFASSIDILSPYREIPSWAETLKGEPPFCIKASEKAPLVLQELYHNSLRSSSKADCLQAVAWVFEKILSGGASAQMHAEPLLHGLIKKMIREGGEEILPILEGVKQVGSLELLIDVAQMMKEKENREQDFLFPKTRALFDAAVRRKIDPIKISPRVRAKIVSFWMDIRHIERAIDFASKIENVELRLEAFLQILGNYSHFYNGVLIDVGDALEIFSRCFEGQKIKERLERKKERVETLLSYMTSSPAYVQVEYDGSNLEGAKDRLLSAFFTHLLGIQMGRSEEGKIDKEEFKRVFILLFEEMSSLKARCGCLIDQFKALYRYSPKDKGKCMELLFNLVYAGFGSREMEWPLLRRCFIWEKGASLEMAVGLREERRGAYPWRPSQETLPSIAKELIKEAKKATSEEKKGEILRALLEERGGVLPSDREVFYNLLEVILEGAPEETRYALKEKTAFFLEDLREAWAFLKQGEGFLESQKHWIFLFLLRLTERKMCDLINRSNTDHEQLSKLLSPLLERRGDHLLYMIELVKKGVAFCRNLHSKELETKFLTRVGVIMGEQRGSLSALLTMLDGVYPFEERAQTALTRSIVLGEWIPLYKYKKGDDPFYFLKEMRVNEESIGEDWVERILYGQLLAIFQGIERKIWTMDEVIGHFALHNLQLENSFLDKWEKVLEVKNAADRIYWIECHHRFYTPTSPWSAEIGALAQQETTMIKEEMSKFIQSLIDLRLPDVQINLTHLLLRKLGKKVGEASIAFLPEWQKLFARVDIFRSKRELLWDFIACVLNQQCYGAPANRQQICEYIKGWIFAGRNPRGGRAGHRHLIRGVVDFLKYSERTEKKILYTAYSLIFDVLSPALLACADPKYAPLIKGVLGSYNAKDLNIPYRLGDLLRGILLMSGKEGKQVGIDNQLDFLFSIDRGNLREVIAQQHAESLTNPAERELFFSWFVSRSIVENLLVNFSYKSDPKEDE